MVVPRACPPVFCRPGSGHGIDMNCSAEKASRKWANGAFGRTAAAMGTVAAAILMLGMQAEPAAAARRPWPAPWGDLFGAPPKLRRTMHRAATVPLPKPRPEEAPKETPKDASVRPGPD